MILTIAVSAIQAVLLVVGITLIVEDSFWMGIAGSGLVGLFVGTLDLRGRAA